MASYRRAELQHIRIYKLGVNEDNPGYKYSKSSPVAPS